MKTGHSRTFGRTNARLRIALLRPAAQRRGWKSAGALALAVQRASPGPRSRALPICRRRAAPVAGARRCAAVERRRDRAWPWRRPTPCSRSISSPSGQPRRVAASTGAGRCGSSSGPLRITRPRRRRPLLVACAQRAPRRRSPRNISPRSRPRSTSAQFATNAGFDMVLGGNRQLLYAGLTRGRRSARCSSCAGAQGGRAEWIDAANAARPAPVRKRPVHAGQRARSPPTSAIAITRSCTSPASTPGSTSAPAGAARSSPPAMARSSPPAGPAATAARSRSPTAAASSAAMAI